MRRFMRWWPPWRNAGTGPIFSIRSTLVAWACRRLGTNTWRGFQRGGGSDCGHSAGNSNPVKHNCALPTTWSRWPWDGRYSNRSYNRCRESLGHPGRYALPRFAAFHREIVPRMLASDQLRFQWLELRGCLQPPNMGCATSSPCTATNPVSSPGWPTKVLAG